MAVTAGPRRRPYEITALLGAGGIPEVYRATDISREGRCGRLSIERSKRPH